MPSDRATIGWIGCIGGALLAGFGALGVLASGAVGDARALRSATPTVVAPRENVAASAPARLVVFDFAPTVSAADREVLVRTADLDVAHIEQTFGRRFASPPVVHVLASEGALAGELSERCGVAPARAREMAKLYSGYTGKDLRTGGYTIILDWNRIGPERPIHRLRHELTHVMSHQILPDPRDIPAWFEEGLAELSAHTVSGVAWPRLQSRYFAASMAATGTLTPLSRLTSYEEAFASLGAQLANATESLRLLEQDVTSARVVRVLDESVRGKPFVDAFAAATGVSLASFAEGTPPRLRALAPSYPGIATTPEDPTGPGATYVLYGFKPRSQVVVRISGNGLNGSQRYTMSEQGYLSQYFVAAWPAGTYSIEVTGDGETAKASVVKAARP